MKCINYDAVLASCELNGYPEGISLIRNLHTNGHVQLQLPSIWSTCRHNSLVYEYVILRSAHVRQQREPKNVRSAKYLLCMLDVYV